MKYIIFSDFETGWLVGCFGSNDPFRPPSHHPTTPTLKLHCFKISFAGYHEAILGTVTSFKYFGAVVSNDGSKPEVLSRIAQATAVLKTIWRDNNISLGSKVKLMLSLVSSIYLYACKSWALTAELEKRTHARLLR